MIHKSCVLPSWLSFWVGKETSICVDGEIPRISRNYQNSIKFRAHYASCFCPLGIDKSAMICPHPLEQICWGQTCYLVFFMSSCQDHKKIQEVTRGGQGLKRTLYWKKGVVGNNTLRSFKIPFCLIMAAPWEARFAKQINRETKCTWPILRQKFCLSSSARTFKGPTDSLLRDPESNYLHEIMGDSVMLE
jgi:hypothetical protein